MILKSKAVDSGQWAVGGQQSAAHSALWVGSAQRPVGSQSAVGGSQWAVRSCGLLQTANWKLRTLLSLLFITILCSATCKYGFKDISIPAEVKTFRVNYFENKAQYVNPQLSSQLTEKLKQKIIGTTRLRQTNNDDAHFDISGYVSQYYTSTTGISNNNASTNRLTVGFHLFFKNTLDETKNFESDLSRNFDFPASQSLSQAESSLNTEIIRNIVDEIFNKIFSNW